MQTGWVSNMSLPSFFPVSRKDDGVDEATNNCIWPKTVVLLKHPFFVTIFTNGSENELTFSLRKHVVPLLDGPLHTTNTLLVGLFTLAWWLVGQIDRPIRSVNLGRFNSNRYIDDLFIVLDILGLLDTHPLCWLSYLQSHRFRWLNI